MNNPSEKKPRRWLSPGAALNRFKPPRGIAIGIASVERQRARYGFRIGEIGLLIDQDTTSEVLERGTVYPLPNTPSWFPGLINLRGNLVPVFDPKLFLGLEGSGVQEKRWLLVLDQGDRAVGFYSDGLPQIALTRHALSRLPPLPAALRPHVAKAFAQDSLIWLEFDHRGFFQTLGGQISGIS